LPRRLRQHFFNVYAYCRWADDLADETDHARRSLELLDWWERQLDDCYRGETQHPVFVALADTIAAFAIPSDPFRDLLTAFRQDQRQTRYETFDDLLGYCRHSANPVGRIVLHLGRCVTDENVRLSDSICTGLQLANFCQDVARDYARERIYLPRESWQRFGYDEAMFARRGYNGEFRKLLQYEVTRAGNYLEAGWPLVSQVPRKLRIPVALFVRGGCAILNEIADQNYDVWSRRPVVRGKYSLFVSVLISSLLGGLSADDF
jgi:squalene synthase HpnC